MCLNSIDRDMYSYKCVKINYTKKWKISWYANTGNYYLTNSNSTAWKYPKNRWLRISKTGI